MPAEMHKLFDPTSVPGLSLPSEQISGETEIDATVQSFVTLPTWQLLAFGVVLLCLLVLVIWLSVKRKKTASFYFFQLTKHH